MLRCAKEMMLRIMIRWPGVSGTRVCIGETAGRREGNLEHLI